MSIYKRIADAITVARALLVWSSLAATQAGFYPSPLMMTNWTGDAGRRIALARHAANVIGRDLRSKRWSAWAC
jgi:hypothetical protein